METPPNVRLDVGRHVVRRKGRVMIAKWDARTIKRAV
jgi:hypothetical protein